MFCLYLAGKLVTLVSKILLERARMNRDKKGKVILFPRVKERLVEEGLEALEEKRYEEALYFFSEAEQLGERRFSVQLSMALCHYELGNFHEAERRLRVLLQENEGNTDLLQMYLSILMQTQRYEQAEAVIRDALRHHPLPTSFRENLLHLFRFVQKMNKRPLPPAEQEKVQRLFESNDIAEHMHVIKQLEKEDIAPVLPLLKQYLINETNSPIVKTMLLRLLTLKNIDDVVTVEKFGKRIEVIPAMLNEQAETAFAAELLERLERCLANENPSLYDVAAEIWLRYTYVLYPFSPEPAASHAWMAALHFVACQFQGAPVTMEKIAARYGVSVEEIAALCDKLCDIENFSYF
jgi:tetratricopeptide (TPR) repeat protein